MDVRERKKKIEKGERRGIITGEKRELEEKNHERTEEIGIMERRIKMMEQH